MTDIKEEPKIENLDQPEVQVLLNQFKKRREMNVVDVSEVVYKLITTLRLDKSSGRPKELGTVSGWHLGQLLGIGKGVVSQYMSVWNMPRESKEFLRNYNLLLIDAYTACHEKGKDEAEKIKNQKAKILSFCSTTGGVGKKTDNILHSVNKAQLILNSTIGSNKIPKEILKPFPDDSGVKITHEYAMNRVDICRYNIEQCINFLSPRIAKLSYLRKELEFCIYMSEGGYKTFCGVEITSEMLHKELIYLQKEIILIEAEYKLPQISSLMVMKNELEKNI